MESELFMILAGAGTSFLIQVFKNTFKNMDTMLIVAIISAIVGSGYALLNNFGLFTKETWQLAKYMFASSIVVFNILKHIAKRVDRGIQLD